MKYVVIGAGGTGGILGAELYKAGNDVSLIARGEHLNNIKTNGLTVRYMESGSENKYLISAYSEDEYKDKADVIFVCVKSYSVLGTIPLIARISDQNTVIIPVLNIFTTGETIRRELPNRYVLDGCIYVSANIEAPGRLLRHSEILRVVYGTVSGQETRPVLNMIKQELERAGIDAVWSDNIRRDSLKKFCYVSPIGAAGLYFHATAGDFQREGQERDMFISLMGEIGALAAGMGCAFDGDVIGNNLEILSHQPPGATTSMQRDIYAGRESEIQGLVYDIPELGRKYNVNMPLYKEIADTIL